MFKRLMFFLLLVIFTIPLSGCATTRKQNDLEIQGLRNQISALENQLSAKDEEINNLRQSTIAKEERTVQTKKRKVIAEVKSRPKVKQIQIALRNAGYEPGSVDGKMGKQTRDAIKAFQRANNLSVDGKVGKDTWLLLRENLYKKTK